MFTYEEAVKYILDIPRFSAFQGGRSKSGNDNLSYIMEKLNNPHLKGKTIHIAGTNGKGSTATFIKNILNARGYKVGVFTSPHLEKINERISVDDSITDEDFLLCFKIVKKACDEACEEGLSHLSFFEYIFAMAAVYFEIKSPDYIIYETGLGGRLDATNLVCPVITVITSIGLDHEKYLGNTIEDIAKEKAGIIKYGVPVVYNTGEEVADGVIEKYAADKSSKAINVAKTDYIINEFTDKTIDFSLSNSYYKYDNLFINSNGATYQIKNAITAIEVCNEIFKDDLLTKEQILIALQKFYWPGRMEKIHNNIILDGAHNEDAINEFISSVKKAYSHRQINLLFAVAEDKNYERIIASLCEQLTIHRVMVTTIDSDRGTSAELIARLFKDNFDKLEKTAEVEYNPSIRDGFLRSYLQVKDTEQLLFCVGSLYLIGSIKEIAREVL